MAVKQKKLGGWVIGAVVLVLVASGLAVAFNFPGTGKGEQVKAANGLISLPVSKVNDGKSHLYRFSDGGKDIRFFVVKAADGTIKTAFDACDVCYREKKGYEQQGDKMLCRNCNQKFAIDRIGPHAVGGCNPSYLPHQEAGGNIVITVADLKSGAKFF